MMRSLYSGISGLKNHQTRMDVIGNNISNVNTVGYKTARTIFQDIFSQTIAGGMANRLTPENPEPPAAGEPAVVQTGIGGTNPIQVGLGINLASIDVLHTPSSYQRSDNPYDAMINGEGYFILMDQNNDYYYARAGNFHLDDEGYLVSSHGYYVMGYTYPLTWAAATQGENEEAGEPAGAAVGETVSTDLQRIRMRVIETRADDPDTTDVDESETGVPHDLTGFKLGDDGSVNVIINNVEQTIGYLGVSMFSNANGLEKAGDSLYRQSSASGVAQQGRALANGAGNIMGGGLEMSNVDLATEFTDMIVTQRGFQANSRTITVSDTLLEELVNLKR